MSIMTIHHSVDSLHDLFLSEQYMSDKSKYEKSHQSILRDMNKFLNSIDINKQYFRTGIIVKNPKYKKKVSQETQVLKSFKTSLNKMSSLNYESLSQQVVKDIQPYPHLYPIVFQSIIEQALLHHTYSKYYGYLVEHLHKLFRNESIIQSQLVKTKETIETTHINQQSSSYDDLCKKNKYVDQLIGYSMFVSDLEVRDIIQGYVEPTLQSLLTECSKELSEDELYKCVLCLSTIYKVVYDSNPLPESHQTSLTEIKSKIRFMKIKFKIMDILERR